jgi:hypothetical protein
MNPALTFPRRCSHSCGDSTPLGFPADVAPRSDRELRMNPALGFDP